MSIVLKKISFRTITVLLRRVGEYGMNSIYAVNWCVSRWNGRDTMDVIIFLISRPGGLTHEKV